MIEHIKHFLLTLSSAESTVAFGQESTIREKIGILESVFI
jgi:hypothetical protein